MANALMIPSACDIVMQEIGPMTLQDADYIAWEYTGYPCFWNIPADGATPTECFRKQLRDFKAAADHPSGEG